MSHKVVTTDLEYLMAAARPRLVRFACAQGITADAADDVVQETLLEAWRHFDRLYSLESFEAWLYGICRNVCRRWMRERRVQLQHALPMEVVQDTVLFNIPDPLNLDPAEELSLQDLQVLLDHALGYLSDENRLLIELCYLAEMPQRETALRLGTTIHALESRLYRACRQLHQVLTRELRTEAEIFGLTNACVHTYTHSAVQRFRRTAYLHRVCRSPCHTSELHRCCQFSPSQRICASREPPLACGFSSVRVPGLTPDFELSLPIFPISSYSSLNPVPRGSLP